jgi:hypothetical protein
MKEQDQTSDQSVGVADEKVTASIRSRAHSMTHRNTLSERAGAAKANTSDSSPTRYSFTLRECRSPIGKIFFFSFLTCMRITQMQLQASPEKTIGLIGQPHANQDPHPRRFPVFRCRAGGARGYGDASRDSGGNRARNQAVTCCCLKPASKPPAMSPNPPLPHRETTGSPGCNSQPTDLNSGSMGGAINIWEIIIVVCEMFDLKSPSR